LYISKETRLFPRACGVFNHRTQTFIHLFSSFTWKRKKKKKNIADETAYGVCISQSHPRACGFYDFVNREVLLARRKVPNTMLKL
jgi:hypothetical protein